MNTIFSYKNVLRTPNRTESSTRTINGLNHHEMEELQLVVLIDAKIYLPVPMLYFIPYLEENKNNSVNCKAVE
jgi:hypothetical protein